MQQLKNKFAGDSSVEIQLYKMPPFCNALPMMLKRFLMVLPVLLLTGCAGTFSRLTPAMQPRNANNLYPVEVAFNSKQQSLRWDSIQPYVLVAGQLYPMRPEPMMKNRWEGLVPVPPSASSVDYRFKFDYLYNSFGKDPQPNSVFSPTYKLTIVEP